MKLQQAAIRSLLILLAVMNSMQVANSETISLSTYELPPYVGRELENQGAILEIVTKAFESSGYTTEINFFPPARAITNAAQGMSTAVFPVSRDSKFESSFLFSDSFPGIQLGLLRKKRDSRESQSFTGKKIGVVRGTFSSSILNNFESAIFLESTKNELLLKMLFAGRIDYLLIDKFTAADLMVDKLPHMIGKLEFIEKSIIPINFHVAFTKQTLNSSTALSAFNKGLKKIVKDGTLDSILYNHGLLSFKKSDKKTLRIATVSNSDMITMKRLSTAFEKEHPDIELDWRVIDESLLRRRLLSDLAVSDGQYDIMTIGAYEAPIWAQKNWLTPITNLPEKYDNNDLIKTVRDGLSYNSQLFALPFYAESSMTYYRKDLFSQAGISMAAAPTWEQIKSYAAKIHDPANKIYGICLRGKAGWGENIALLSTIINTYGGQWFDMNWNAKIDSPEWESAVSLYLDLMKNYGPPEVENNGYSETLALFSSGHCGIWIDATVAASTLFNPNKSTVANSLGFAPAPVSITPKGSQWLWIWALAVPSASKLPKEALQFISWATSKDYIKTVAQEEGWVAAPPGTRYSTYYNKEYASVAPFATFVLNAIENSEPKDSTLKPSPYTGVQYISIPEFPALGVYVGNKINQTLRGKITIKAALKDAQEFSERKIRAAGYK